MEGISWQPVNPEISLSNSPQIERASAGLGRQVLPATLSAPKDGRKLAFLTLGPESQSGDPLLTLREWFLPEVRQLIWHLRPVS